MPLHKQLTQNVQDEKFEIRNSKFDQKLIFLLWRKVYILYIQKQTKQVNVTVLLFILYWTWFHKARNPKWIA